MAIEPLFPEHLLQASNKDRMMYYVNDVIVDHPILTDALESIDEMANPLLEKRLILLVGGTGVGKSALMRKLVAKRISGMTEILVANPQLVPAIFVETESPDKGNFAFSSLYRDALAQMNAPLIDRTLPIIERRTSNILTRTIAIEKAGHRLDATALKLRFMENLIDREVNLVCLDEAVNIFKVGRPRSEADRIVQLKDQSDKLKTFINKTPTSLVLGGAYDFLELTMGSGQLARRSFIVHMPPYKIEKVSLEGFATALVGLIAHLPIEHEIDPNEHATEFFLQCLGCIGSLKNILSVALLQALNAGRILSIKIIRQCYFTAAQLDVMRKEMEIGIARVNELMTMEQLAESATPITSAQPPRSTSISLKNLAPGETKPSHRHDATESWNK